MTDARAQMKDDHEMVYQHANITENGLQTTGVASSWYCDETNRVYIFYYTTLPEFATQQDVLREFQQHLDSFVCH